jgi:hypothetical protein
MQFLKEIREHLKDFETEASEEMHKFIDFLHTKYPEVRGAIVEPPAPLAMPAPEPTFTAPVLNVVEAPVEASVEAPVEAVAEPVAEAQPVETPVAEETPKEGA